MIYLAAAIVIGTLVAMASGKVPSVLAWAAALPSPASHSRSAPTVVISPVDPAPLRGD
jgi:hypothetical protein